MEDQKNLKEDKKMILSVIDTEDVYIKYEYIEFTVEINEELCRRK